MEMIGWAQLALFLGALILITPPLGAYLLRVLAPEGRTWLDPVTRPLETSIYRVLGVDPGREQNWREYAFSLLVFSLVGMILTYAILRLQGLLPLNPQHLPGLSAHLAFNTAVSFATNTDWQSYVPEATMSYFSQMVGLAYHNFVSSAVGIAVAAALVRGIARASGEGIGNFWSDLVRINLYLLLPICICYALFLVSQGVIQNFAGYTQATGLEGAAQSIGQGPMASQIAIKMLGTNGGGFMNANAAHPFENPGPLSNFIQMLSIFAIPSAMTWYLGRMVKKPGHGRAIWTVMSILFLAGTLVAWNAESRLPDAALALRIDPAGGNMEGKEVRFGIFNSALFATVTTDASCGAVNAMHDSFTPLGGLVPLFNLQLGEVIFGGTGAGLYGMLIFVVITVFIAGLMIGRTPEYLGKKIGAFEVKVAMVALLVPIFSILVFTAWAAISAWGTGALNNAGPHGLGEMLYAFTSATGNNGSAFAGLSANAAWWNTTLGFAMLMGRFFIIIPVLALAGSLAGKKTAPAGEGSFPVSGATFAVLLLGTVLIVGGLTFLPVLAMGPIVEHFLMLTGKVF